MMQVHQGASFSPKMFGLKWAKSHESSLLYLVEKLFSTTRLEVVSSVLLTTFFGETTVDTLVWMSNMISIHDPLVLDPFNKFENTETQVLCKVYQGTLHGFCRLFWEAFFMLLCVHFMAYFTASSHV